MQIDLLRVLETKQFNRIGGNQEVSSNFRLVCATNRNLEALVEDGVFREDLYYRINVFSLDLPPLRERREDIPILAHHFVEAFARAMGKPVKDISPAAETLLLNYKWPGNVRELENAIERAMVISKDPEILPGDLPLHVERRGEHPPELSLSAVEKQHIERVLREEDGNISRAAITLGIDRGTLYNKMKRYGIRRVE
jgi:DNA-binding NtrC family response regulator